jgi:hypothetical protein
VKPKVADAKGWDLAIGMNNEFYEFVEIHSPTEMADSWTGGNFARDSWYKVIVPGKRPKYFFGETAWMDAQRYAGDEDRKVKA